MTHLLVRLTLVLGVTFGSSALPAISHASAAPPSSRAVLRRVVRPHPHRVARSSAATSATLAYRYSSPVAITIATIIAACDVSKS